MPEGLISTSVGTTSPLGEFPNMANSHSGEQLISSILENMMSILVIQIQD